MSMGIVIHALGGIMDWINKIHLGPAPEVLHRMPDKLVDMVMTSPPYWGLRDYGVEGQLGLEPTFDEYIDKLCNIFDEVKRVLQDTGTIWVNLGDTYSANRSYQVTGTLQVKNSQPNKQPHQEGYPDKSLCMIPQRFAIEMVNRGWILRNVIIWHKNNCMPSSAKDRFTVDFEYLYFFSKNKKYYFEQQFEEHITNENRPDAVVRNRLFGYNSKENTMRKTRKNNTPKNVHNAFRGNAPQGYDGKPMEYGSQGRNKRCVWNINTHPYSETHFAVYPEELCITPIKAGCPQFVCKKCGAPREKIFDSKFIPQEDVSKEKGIRGHDDTKDMDKSNQWQGFPRGRTEHKIKGYAECNCNAEYKPGVVLDPFSGAGTTSLVARKLGRNYIGIELNPEYISIAEKRIHNEAGLL